MLLDIPGVRVRSDLGSTQQSGLVHRAPAPRTDRAGAGYKRWRHMSSVLGANTKVVLGGCLAHYGVNRAMRGSAVWMIYPLGFWLWPPRA